jgi:methylmalonyl-CoA mutase N-terminal domain/subunit
MDEALGLPTEKAVRLALRTQQVIAHESGVADSVDPLAGSYLVESLTDEIEHRAEDYIRQIDEMGGSLRSIETGYIQNEIQTAAYDFQRALEEQDEIVVGVNAFQVKENREVEPLQLDPAIGEKAVARLEALRQRRDAGQVDNLLNSVMEAARGDENLMPIFINCVEAGATLGEICAVLRDVWGEYTPPAWI